MKVVNCNCCAWNDPQRLSKGAGEVEKLEDEE